MPVPRVSTEAHSSLARDLPTGAESQTEREREGGREGERERERKREREKESLVRALGQARSWHAAIARCTLNFCKQMI